MEEQTTQVSRIQTSGTPTAPLNEGEVLELNQKLRSTKGWVKFIGITTIVLGCTAGIVYPILGMTLAVMGGGVAVLLILLGLIGAAVLIWIGVLLTQSASGANLYLDSGNEHGLVTYHTRLRRYFTFQGILTIIGLALLALFIVVLIVALFAGGLGGLF